MASEIYLIDQDDNRLYLSGPGTPYSGSGSPWQSQGTSPYKLSLNDVTGSVYTPLAPTPVPILAGSPPLSLGSQLIAQGYGNVEEPVGIQCYATSHANAVALAHQLRSVLAQAERPPVLAVQPEGASSPVYYELMHSRLQETMHFINQEAGASPQIVRLQGTWMRTPFGGRLTGETLLNAVSMANASSGSPSNLVSLGTAGAGELVTAGSPLNLTLTPAAGGHFRWYLATVADRIFASRSDSLVTSTAEATAVTGLDMAFTNIVAAGARPRILLRVTSPSANLELKAYARDSSSSAAKSIYRSPWVRPDGVGTDHLLDMGGWRDRLGDTDFASGNYSIRIAYRSTDGLNTSGTLAGIELLGCHTFATVTGGGSAGSSLRVLGFRPRSGRPALPMAPLIFDQQSGAMVAQRELAGRPPVYIRGASLWGVFMHAGSSLAGTVWTPSGTYTATATHAPLYHTLRGNG